METTLKIGDQVPITISLARSPREIDDALWLRHEVFVIEDGKFGGQALHGERLIDKFDAFPNVYHVIAYEDEHPVATMRLVRDSAVGLPVDELYDFTEFRTRARDDLPRLGPDWANRDAAVFGSAGMLAIRKPWRRRRDVIRAMFRMAATVCQCYGASHVMVVVNHETAGMYRRFGFVPLAEKIWVEKIGGYVIPLAGVSQEFLSWAMGGAKESALADFQDGFGRLVLRQNEAVCQRGSAGANAYLAQSGEIRSTRQTPADHELTLAPVGPGPILGELALIDDPARAASAISVSHSELMRLDGHTSQSQLQTHPEHSRSLFKVFAHRMRSMDELTMGLAFSPPSERLYFAMDTTRKNATPEHQ